MSRFKENIVSVLNGFCKDEKQGAVNRHKWIAFFDTKADMKWIEMCVELKKQNKQKKKLHMGFAPGV